MNRIAIQRALLSVSEKKGIADFAKRLSEMEIEILSTGGTARVLTENGIPVVSVDSYTGHPEIMDGRVKTLHPRVHGGILAVRDNAVHNEQMQRNGIKPIDLVVVNLYPFVQTIAKPGISIEEAIENIDIGGPAMVRSAAKNHAYVTVIVDPSDYPVVIEELVQNRAVSGDLRKRFAAKAFAHTAAYDTAIAYYLEGICSNGKRS